MCPPILEIAQQMTGAVAACFYLIDEPELFIPAEMEEVLGQNKERFLTSLSGLSDEIHINPDLAETFAEQYATRLVVPIYIQQQVVGMLLLLGDAVAALTGESKAMLLSLVDGLRIVTVQARSLARHKKLIRNQSEFTRIVSHDLRSPLTSIQGFASMLESDMVGALNEKQAHFVEKILSGLAQMTSLVDNIQDAGRYDPETGFYEMERTQCDLVEIVNRIVNNHLVPAEKQELTIVAKSADDVPIIKADSNMLERALINLVDNAIKYTPNGGHIEVGVYRQDDQVILSVRDDGYGISPENQRRMFERHVRIPRREHRKVKGSGLGLFIVRSVAQRHGDRPG